MKKILWVVLLCACHATGWAQGTLSGDVMANVNFFQKDSALGVNQFPHYQNQLSGGEFWLSLRYNYKGFTAFLRADAFHNSNLYIPTKIYSGFGIGAWSLSKDFQDLTVTAGYIYDQVGSGLLFRAYEDRGLLIDNALVGAQLKYKISDRLNVKAFTGQQKFLQGIDADQTFAFERHKAIVKGIAAEGDYNIGDKVSMVTGGGVIDRTLDQGTIDQIANNINAIPDVKDRFVPKYNTYAATLYNTMNVGDFSWYIEGAYKTKEAVRAGLIDQETFSNHDGNVVFTTLGYARKGIAVNFTGKRTENFIMRSNPYIVPVYRGTYNWQPIVARIRPQRLMSRYTPPALENSELALGGDVLIAPNDDISITLNYTHINTLDNIELYREAYGEVEFRNLGNWIIDVGVQQLHYNQRIYQFRPTSGIVKAVTPFVEGTYKFSDKHSIRFDLQYMFTEQDYGSWAYGLVEFNIAPKWSFATFQMYTTDLKPGNPSNLTEPQLFYNYFIAYTKGPHRFTAAYVRQPDGINCTGGVCRYEPAFSGAKFTMTSSF